MAYKEIDPLIFHYNRWGSKYCKIDNKPFNSSPSVVNGKKLPRVAIIIVISSSKNTFEDTFNSVLQLSYPTNLLELFLIDNNSKYDIEQVVRKCYQNSTDRIDTKFEKIDQCHKIGKGIDFVSQLVSIDAEYFLFLNPNCLLYEDTLNKLISAALSSLKYGFRLWECRQIPYEYPKYYNPVTLETIWSSFACCLIEKMAFIEIKGFDEKFYSDIEDLDIPFRFRSANYRLMYVPSARIFYNSFNWRTKFKVNKLNNSSLIDYDSRYKYGSLKDVIRFEKMFWSFFLSLPKNLEPRRSSMLALYLKHFFLIPSAIVFRIKKRQALHSYKPLFFNFDFDMHQPWVSKKTDLEELSIDSLPKVSIIVRTIGKTNFLREALISIRNQTYPNIEVIVVEDGPATVQEMLQSEFGDLSFKYIPLGENHGRAYAGNCGLEYSEGKFLRFLDEDDLLFANSVETAVTFILKDLERVKMVYDLAFAVPTLVLSEDPLQYKEYGYIVKHYEEFNRKNLLDHNYIPIQCALFDRDLKDTCGGFDENLEIFEDWDLWIRYSMKTDFLKIPLVTSLYRVPSDPAERERRKILFDSYRSKVKSKYL